MEGGDLKKMARAKRNSSQRSKVKHSRHHGPGSNAPIAVAEDALLPSNWERYASDDEGAASTLAEGEIRPKSKGADYSELLSTALPELYDEPPELGGMMAMLIANDYSGLWEWGTNYLDPAFSTSERQTVRDAAALLDVDVGLLGKSISRLSVAERLFVEDDLFPKQTHVHNDMEAFDTTKMNSDTGGRDVINDESSKEHDYVSFSSRVNVLGGGKAENSTCETGLDLDFDVLPERGGSTIDIIAPLGSDTKASSVQTGDFIHHLSPDVHSHAVDVKKSIQMEIVREPFEKKKFEAASVEAELDDLLNMLDNKEAGLFFNKASSSRGDPVVSSTLSSNFVSPSYDGYEKRGLGNSGLQEGWAEARSKDMVTNSLLGLQDGWAEARPKEVITNSLLGEDPSPNTGAVSASTSEVEVRATFSGVQLSEEDDFDSWLDSI